MMDKSDYRMINLTIIKKDWEDKDRGKKRQTLTKTLTFNSKIFRILTLFHQLDINYITLLIWIPTLTHTLITNHGIDIHQVFKKMFKHPKLLYKKMNKKYNPETNSNQIFDKTVTQISNWFKK